MYTIHGTRNGIHIPCAFALLPDKRESTYTAVLEKLKDLRPLLEPHTVITDFEQAAMNSFKNVFGAQLHGCHFHFGQCVWCKVQENGCAAQYHTDKNFSMHIRMLVALAYVPLADKGRVYNKLVKLESFPEVDPLLGYFEETFIGRQKRKVRSIPLFAPEIWDCYQGVLDDAPRTNNVVEGWHNAFASSVRIAHPTLPKLIDKLQKEQSGNELTLERRLGGESPPPKKKKIQILIVNLRR